MSAQRRHDVVIIGAGAAGLAAGQALSSAAVDFIILEASERIGGRAHTDETSDAFPIELGAEFIHGDNAPTHRLLLSAHMKTVPVARMANLWWGESGGAAVHWEQLPPPLTAEFRRLFDDYSRLAAVSLAEDCSLADYLRQLGWGEASLARADVLFAQTCCASLDDLSCYDLIREMRADRAGAGEARLQEGYGAFLRWYARDLPIRQGTIARRIEWGRGGVTISTDSETYRARKAIITIPVALLQLGALVFHPPLSARKRWAIEAFRTAPATKLIYRFRKALWDDKCTYLAHTGRAARWWPSRYQQSDNVLMCCYVTDARALWFDAMKETEALENGLAELAQLLGVTFRALKDELVWARRVSWARQPFARGGYAHLPSGSAQARPLLAEPEGDVLFFAGEATAFDSNPQTVHGALESGWRAARQCLAS